MDRQCSHKNWIIKTADTVVSFWRSNRKKESNTETSRYSHTVLQYFSGVKNSPKHQINAVI